MKKLMQSVTENKDTLALLAGGCMFLSIIENIIPKPVPFIRIGIANIPILVSLKIFNTPLVIVLVFLKILVQGIATGTLFSYIFIFSFAGSLAGGLAMIAAYRLFGKYITMTGVSVFGALASNSVQIAAASFFIFGRAAVLIGPPVLITGTVTSLFIGIFAEAFIQKSRWLASVKNADI